MEDETLKGIQSMGLSSEKEKEIMLRCFKMVDYLNDIATDIIMEFFNNTSCSVAKQILRNSPEILAIKAFEKAISDLSRAFHKPDLPLN